MKIRPFIFITLLFAAAAGFAFMRAGSASNTDTVSPAPTDDNAKAGKTMRPFGSEQELKDYLRAAAANSKVMKMNGRIFIDSLRMLFDQLPSERRDLWVLAGKEKGPRMLCEALRFLRCDRPIRYRHRDTS